MHENLHSLNRRLIELRMAHAELDASIDAADRKPAADELLLRRLKKRRLALRDEMERLRLMAEPPELA
jgi:hypothetical protein